MSVKACEDKVGSEPFVKARAWSGDAVGTVDCVLTATNSLWHWVEIRNRRSHAVEVSIRGTMDRNPPPTAKFVSALATTRTDRRWDYSIPVARRPTGWLGTRWRTKTRKFVSLEKIGNGGSQTIKTSIAVDLTNGRPPVDLGPLEIIVDL